MLVCVRDGVRRLVPLVRFCDYITAWIGQASGEDTAVTFNQHWHGAMLRAAAKAGATPVYYAYVIAFLARAHDGLNDCDVASGSLSLCIRGADFIRRQRSLILDTYEAFARATAAELPSASHRVVWLLEPDFYQYSEHSSTQLLRMVRGDDVVWERYGGLEVGAMVELMVGMIERIKRHLPNAAMSMDVSP